MMQIHVHCLSKKININFKGEVGGNYKPILIKIQKAVLWLCLEDFK